MSLVMAILGFIMMFYLHQDKFESLLGMFSSTLITTTQSTKDLKFAFHSRSPQFQGTWNMYTSAHPTADAAANDYFILSRFYLFVLLFQEFIRVFSVNFIRIWLMNPSVSELFLVTLFVLSIIFSFVPIDHTDIDSEICFVGLNSDFAFCEPSSQELIKQYHSGINNHIFSLENACLLMECSWYWINYF